MDILNSDSVFSIMKFLELENALNLAKTCKKNYGVFLDRDVLWQTWSICRFGKINKNINWFLTYKNFIINYNKAIDYAREISKVTSFNVESYVKYTYNTLLFREDNKPVIIPRKYK